MSDSKEDIATATATGGNPQTQNASCDQKNEVHEVPLQQVPTKDELDHTKSMNETIHNAKTATDKEHRMTLWQGIKLYPKAVAWSLLISTCICMEGYDVCLLSNFCKFMSRTFGYIANIADRWISPVQPKVWRAASRWVMASACTVAGWPE